MNGLKKTILAATAVFVLGLGGTAHAMAIKGTIGFTGVYDPNTGDLNTATGIIVVLANAGTATGDFDLLVNTQTDATPDFDTTSDGTLTYNSFSFITPITPIIPLWDNSSVSFDLEAITLVDQTTTNQLQLKGTGTFKAAGYDDTKGTWEFTANQTVNGQIGGFTFSTSESGAPLPPGEVPEPGTVILFGTGLAGLALWRKRQTRA